MSEFSYGDINEAKRRVQEMRNRAREQPESNKKNDIITIYT